MKVPRNYKPASLEISSFASSLDLGATRWEIIMLSSSKLLMCWAVKVNPAKQIGRELVKWQETYLVHLWHSIAPHGLQYLLCLCIFYICFQSAWSCFFKKKPANNKTEAKLLVSEMFHNFHPIIFNWYTVYITIFQSLERPPPVFWHFIIWSF